jgi:hypothetical protein
MSAETGAASRIREVRFDDGLERGVGVTMQQHHFIPLKSNWTASSLSIAKVPLYCTRNCSQTSGSLISVFDSGAGCSLVITTAP